MHGHLAIFLATGYVSDQNEHLGQGISLEPPPVEPQPPTYEAYLFSAREPEWQCSSPFSFQPVSCQIRAEIAASETDFGMHTLYDPDKRPGDPSYISLDYEESQNPAAIMRPILYSMLKGTVKPREIKYGGGFKVTPDTEYPAETAMRFYRYLKDGQDMTDISDFKDASYGDPPPPTSYNLDDLLDNAEGVIKNAKDKCAELLGPDALAKFKKLRQDRKIKYGEVHGAEATTDGDRITLDPNTYVFDPDYRLAVIPGSKYNTKKLSESELRKFEKMVSESGASSRYDYATAAVIHEFLHAIGKFPPDVTVNVFGEVDNSQSRKNQRQVVEKCFKKGK